MSKQLLIAILFVSCFVQMHAQDIVKVKEINPAPNGNSSPYNFTVANNKLFFIAYDNINYNRLWVTDGTTGNTQMLGPAGGASGSVSNLVSFNNRLYFSFNDNINGAELWVSDGTVAGTTMLKDIYTGSSGSSPRGFTVANNKLFFMADDVNGQRRLYVSNGTAAGTVVLKNNYIDLFNGLTSFAILNNEIYFRGDNGSGSGNGLWKSDGISVVLLAPDIIPGTMGCNYAVLNNKLYFNGFDYTNGSELWVSDGTAGGTHIVVNIGPDAGGVLANGGPSNLVVYNGKLYYPATENVNGAELWVSDGTAAGTHLVKDIFPGATGSQPFDITVYKGLLYIYCSLTFELWKSDGTATGTQLVKAVLPYSRIAANWNNKLYFTNSFDNLLWESDGTAAGTGPMKVQNTSDPVYSMGADLTFTQYNGDLYFSGLCYLITSGYELCKLTVGGAAVTSFSFTGNGNWSNPANWSGGLVPPANLPSGYSIVINGNCILDVAQHILTGASLTVAAGKSLTILGSLNIL
ncbi:MAG: ELWxxDGT repeat protein [Ferruginibacter sp.]